MLKHLLYHAYPLKNQATEENLALLKKHLPIFNGRKLITIAQDENTLSLKDVKKRLANDAEFFVVPNSPLGEQPGFIPMLEKVISDSNDLIFYGHTKGVAIKSQAAGIQFDLKSVARWRDEMYHHCLDCIDKIEKILSYYTCCGCFQDSDTFIYPDQLLVRDTKWHFSGSFFWVHAGKLYQRNWKNIADCRYGVEAYLGRIIDKKEAFCLVNLGGFYDKYNMTQAEWNMLLRVGTHTPAFCIGSKYGSNTIIKKEVL